MAEDPTARDPGSPADQPELAGPNLAREALARAKQDAARRGANPARAAVRTGRAGVGRDRPAGYSGSGPDRRDPQPFGSAIGELLAAQGWEATARSATVLSGWDSLVGRELAAHCRPESLLDGELVLVAESTAWATQVRLLAPALLARLREQLGAATGGPGTETVRRITVRGPTTPNWAHGPRRVKGRGPRDTYG